MAETRRKELKKCGVCGDNALGSNFNAITCESCKAFFRRNALKTKDFKCPFDNNCKVDIVTRRFCQKCRLKKCFEIGMKKEWIMTEDEKRAKRKKIEKNRQKKCSQQQQEETISYPEVTFTKIDSPDPSLNNILLSPASSMSPLTPQTPGSVGIVAEPNKSRMFAHQPLTPSDYEYSPPAKVVLVDGMDDVYSDTGQSCQSDIVENVRAHNFSGSSSPTHFKDYSQNGSESQNHNASKHIVYSPEHHPSHRNGILKKDVHTTNNGKGTFEGKLTNDLNDLPVVKTEDLTSDLVPDLVYRKAVAIEFTELPIRGTSNDSKDLSALERSKLQELVVANAVLKMPLSCGITDPSLLDVINMTDHAIRRLIKMSKKIASFKNLCQNDQIALLKGGCTELMILRSVMSYDPEKECWRGPHGPKRMSIKVDVLKEAKGNVYEEHKRFISSFQPHWRTDENIMLILSGIALFTPERPNIIHKDVIKLEQDTYYYLLRRYLESIYSTCEAKSSYLKLIHRIQELHILNENHVRVYLDVNPKDVEPLLIEIFDLNH